jgi:hypothetical protein
MVELDGAAVRFEIGSRMPSGGCGGRIRDEARVGPIEPTPGKLGTQRSVWSPTGQREPRLGWVAGSIVSYDGKGLVSEITLENSSDTTLVLSCIYV